MSENTRDAMTAGMPMEIWARDFDAPQYRGEFFKYEPNDARVIKYHHDDKYRALEAENLRLREENERLKTAIAEAKIVQYAVEG